MHINDMARKAHLNARDKGFWSKPREVGTMLALIHSEVSEALEADRRGDKSGFAEELADIVIRVGDLAYALGVELEWQIVDKMERNSRRERLHGKQY